MTTDELATAAGRAAHQIDCFRSLVILPSRRGQKLGRLALATTEQMALQDGASRLHLLTDTAAAFFRSEGYQVADRRDAPQTIRASKEFRSGSPTSFADSGPCAKAGATFRTLLDPDCHSGWRALCGNKLRVLSAQYAAGAGSKCPR